MSLFEESIKPMLLKEKESPFDDPNYIYEIKFDGIRCLIYVSKTSIKVISRNQKDMTFLFPELKNIQKIVKKKTIFDGEIISLEKKAPSFKKLQERIHLKEKEKILNKSKTDPVVFLAFDIIFDGKSLLNRPLIERKEILKTFPDTEEFVKSIYIETHGKKFFQKVKKRNLEGIVAKEKNSIYEPNKRTEKWLKIKNIKSSDFYIGGYEEKKSDSVFSALLGEKKENTFQYVGRVSIPKKNDLFKLLKKSPPIMKSPFEYDKEKNVIYVTPKYICEIEFLEKRKEGKLRHPVFKKWKNEALHLEKRKKL